VERKQQHIMNVARTFRI